MSKSSDTGKTDYQKFCVTKGWKRNTTIKETTNKTKEETFLQVHQV